MAPRRLLSVLVAALIAGCGSSSTEDRSATSTPESTAPALGGPPEETPAPRTQEPDSADDLGFPGFATKNTTRVGGESPARTAAGVALAVFPSRSVETRPTAVTLVDAGDWRAAISAAQLMGPPLRAPVLFSEKGETPTATRAALRSLRPSGAKSVGGASLLRVGGAPPVDGLKARALTGKDYAAQARAIDRLRTRAAGGKATPAVLVASADRPAVAMAAAGYAAKTGTPVLWVRGKEIPAATRAAIRDHGKPRIYLLGSKEVIGAEVATELAKLGRVQRISGRDAPSTAVAFARYENQGFGWNVTDPGHGFVFASAKEPADAAAAAALSASGTYGPLLVVSDGTRLDRVVEGFLLDVQPGYDADPVRGVYNHGWLMGDASTISVDVQARIDALLEIQPVDPETPPQ
jgi:hypothetical protein